MYPLRDYGEAQPYRCSGSDGASHQESPAPRPYKGTTTGGHSEDHAIPIPPPWRAPQGLGVLGRLHRALFNLLCIAAFGHTGLEPVWIAVHRAWIYRDGTFLEASTRQLCDHLNNMLWLGGLLLASAATFLTTEPPRDDILNYNRRSPYICLVVSFGLLIGGIIVGGGCILVTSQVLAYWTARLAPANRFQVYCILVVLSYPFFSIGIATLFLAFGLLNGVWSASDPRLQAASALFLILPLSMILLFALSCASALHRNNVAS